MESTEESFPSPQITPSPKLKCDPPILLLRSSRAIIHPNDGHDDGRGGGGGTGGGGGNTTKGLIFIGPDDPQVISCPPLPQNGMTPRRRTIPFLLQQRRCHVVRRRLINQLDDDDGEHCDIHIEDQEEDLSFPFLLPFRPMVASSPLIEIVVDSSIRCGNTTTTTTTTTTIVPSSTKNQLKSETRLDKDSHGDDNSRTTTTTAYDDDDGSPFISLDVQPFVLSEDATPVLETVEHFLDTKVVVVSTPVAIQPLPLSCTDDDDTSMACQGERLTKSVQPPHV